MILWLALRRLMPLLAVLSLALTPVAAPAATAGMHASMAQGHPAAALDGHGLAGMDHSAMKSHGAASAGMDRTGMAMTGADMAGADMAGADMAGADMDDMPCCPKAEAAPPDCAKGCPLMALCLAGAASLPPAVMPIPVRVATRASLSWPEPALFAGVHGTPLPEPPRA